MKTHGLSYTSEYGTWLSIRRRCTNPADSSYKNHGGRGIRVCDRWLDFMAFWKDLGPRPGPYHYLYRLDGDKDFEPGNCRWATWAEQAMTRRSKHPLAPKPPRPFRAKAKTLRPRKYKPARCPITREEEVAAIEDFLAKKDQP